jgi:N-acetylglucosamine-6-phosphate deacetylase
VMKFVQWDLQQVLPSATMNPARILGLGGRKGTLVSGAEADIAVLKPSGEVIRTIVCGAGI